MLHQQVSYRFRLCDVSSDRFLRKVLGVALTLSLLLISSALVAEERAMSVRIHEPIPELLGEPLQSNNRPVKVVINPKGSVSWNLLKRTELLEWSDGSTEFIAPLYDDAVKRLDRKEVTIKGFMIPLGTIKKQSRFLLSPDPVDCKNCNQDNPTQLIEVRCDSPMTFTFKPILLKGRMELTEDSPVGAFYRLASATMITD